MTGVVAAAGREHDPDTCMHPDCVKGRPEKWCSGCYQLQPADAFWRNKLNPDGYQDWCKGCMRCYRFSYRERERELEHLRKGENRGNQY